MALRGIHFRGSVAGKRKDEMGREGGRSFLEGGGEGIKNREREELSVAGRVGR